MTDALESFLGSISEVDPLFVAKHQDAVAGLGTSCPPSLGSPITPTAIARCYDAAHMKAPRNISDIMGKSRRWWRQLVMFLFLDSSYC